MTPESDQPVAALLEALKFDLEHASVPRVSTDPRQRPSEPLLYVYRLGLLVKALRNLEERVLRVELAQVSLREALEEVEAGLRRLDARVCPTD